MHLNKNFLRVCISFIICLCFIKVSSANRMLSIRIIENSYIMVLDDSEEPESGFSVTSNFLDKKEKELYLELLTQTMSKLDKNKIHKYYHNELGNVISSNIRVFECFNQKFLETINRRINLKKIMLKIIEFKQKSGECPPNLIAKLKEINEITAKYNHDVIKLIKFPEGRFELQCSVYKNEREYKIQHENNKEIFPLSEAQFNELENEVTRKKILESNSCYYLFSKSNGDLTWEIRNLPNNTVLNPFELATITNWIKEYKRNGHNIIEGERKYLNPDELIAHFPRPDFFFCS